MHIQAYFFAKNSGLKSCWNCHFQRLLQPCETRTLDGLKCVIPGIRKTTVIRYLLGYIGHFGYSRQHHGVAGIVLTCNCEATPPLEPSNAVIWLLSQNQTQWKISVFEYLHRNIICFWAIVLRQLPARIISCNLNFWWWGPTLLYIGACLKMGYTTQIAMF